MFGDLFRHFRHGVRILARRPLYFGAVVVTLAIAVAGTTAAFTFVNGILLRPLPYKDSARLVKVCERHPEIPETLCIAAPGNLQDWAGASRTLEALGLARSWPFALKRETGPKRIRGGFATPEVFTVLGADPLVGRVFEPDDVAVGASPVAVVSHDMWVREFGADFEIVGQVIRTDQLEAQVVGVLPEGFSVPNLEAVELWVSFPPDWLQRRDWRGFRPLGRLRATATLAEARSEIQTLAEEFAHRYPETNEGYTAQVVSLHDWVVSPIRRPLWIFMSAVTLVLLIAGANVANLVLAKVRGRRREFAVRLALGAGRRRLTVQLFAENAVLVLAGAALGIPLSWGLVQLVRVLAPAGLPDLDLAQPDVSVLLFSLLVSVLLCSFLAATASRSVRRELPQALREGHRQTGPSRVRMRGMLVVAEVGLAVLLLIGAGLLTRSLFNLLDWRPGFELDHAMVAFMTAPLDKYPTGKQVAEVFRQSIAETAAVPGVTAAGAASGGPLFGGGDGQVRFLIDGRTPPPSTLDYPRANRYDVFPTYFSTLGIALRKGRFFTPADEVASTKVAIVNETLARLYWQGASPVGQRVKLVDANQAPVPVEIVGVVADVPPLRSDRVTEPEIYWPLAQFPRWGTTLVVRTSVEPESVAKSIETRLSRLDPDLQLGSFRTLRELADRELVAPRFFLFLMSVFAGMGLMLAATGIYGVVGGMTAERTLEIATRVALGANRGDILRLVLGQGMLPVMAGLTLGLGGARLAAPLLGNLLVAVDPFDFVSFGAAALVLAGASLLGCYLPARRLHRLDPAATLRRRGN